MGVVRKTKHLEQLLQVFRQSSDAMSASMLLDSFNAEVNKSTVYRMLEKLEDDGVIHSFLTMNQVRFCLLYTSPSPRDKRQSRMPSSA